jgi:hypothetical protein
MCAIVPGPLSLVKVRCQASVPTLPRSVIVALNEPVADVAPFGFGTACAEESVAVRVYALLAVAVVVVVAVVAAVVAGADFLLPPHPAAAITGTTKRAAVVRETFRMAGAPRACLASWL